MRCARTPIAKHSGEVMMDEPWRNMARYFIGEMCYSSWRKSNIMKNGKRRMRHVPYSVPDLAADLVECLDKNDEHKAKAIFLGYDCMELLRTGER